MHKDPGTYSFVDLRNEEDPVVCVATDVVLLLDGHRARLLVVVGHLELRHRLALGDGEGGKGSLLRFEVDVRHTVDRQQRCDDLSAIVLRLGSRALEENTPDWAELGEHFTHLKLADVVVEA